ncbi:unnamed protein product, partial [Mesorhabditis spiculigera]
MRGERLPDGGCACQPYFFGSICQYTSRCDQGHIRHGRWVAVFLPPDGDAYLGVSAKKDWGGDYCHLIVCHYGYPDVMNRSRSCICPPKYKGAHCDQCAQVGPKIGVYPKCAVSLIPRHAMARKKTKSQIRSHLVIILGACGFLAVLALAMAYVHYRRKKAKNPEIELARQQELNERAAMLTEQAMRRYWLSVFILLALDSLFRDRNESALCLGLSNSEETSPANGALPGSDAARCPIHSLQGPAGQRLMIRERYLKGFPGGQKYQTKRHHN